MAGSKIKRYLIVGLVSVLAGSGIATAAAPRQSKVRREKSETVNPQTDREFGFVVTDIVYKPDDNLVRLCGTLSGTPNTSGRIDGVAIVSGKETLDASDIDGVDFNRYFIWEDEGNIYLEIDFPDYKKAKRLIAGRRECKLIFHTVAGDVAMPLVNNKRK